MTICDLEYFVFSEEAKGLVMQKKIIILICSVLICVLTSAGAEGTLQIITHDAEVAWSISIDNEDIPFSQGMEIWLEEGIHRLVASAPGYRQIDQPVRIVDGEYKQIALTADASKLIDTTGMVQFSAQPETGELIVVGITQKEVFSIDGTPSSVPASFELGTGLHIVAFGPYSWHIAVDEDRTTFVRLDVHKGKIDQFNVTADQKEGLASDSSTLPQMFDRGYALYGDRTFWTLRNTLIVLGAFVLFILLCWFRCSFPGRVRARLWKRASLIRKLKRLKRHDPKNRRSGVEKALRKQETALSSLREQVDSMLKSAKQQYEQLRASSTVQDSKRRKRLKRKIAQLMRIRQRLL